MKVKFLTTQFYGGVLYQKGSEHDLDEETARALGGEYTPVNALKVEKPQVEVPKVETSNVQTPPVDTALKNEDKADQSPAQKPRRGGRRNKRSKIVTA